MRYQPSSRLRTRTTGDAGEHLDLVKAIVGAGTGHCDGELILTPESRRHTNFSLSALGIVHTCMLSLKRRCISGTPHCTHLETTVPDYRIEQRRAPSASGIFPQTKATRRRQYLPEGSMIRFTPQGMGAKSRLSGSLLASKLRPDCQTVRK